MIVVLITSPEKRNRWLIMGLIWVMVVYQVSTPVISVAQGNCSEGPGSGRQPFPEELVTMFQRGSTNQLGNQGPDLPQIYKGYPPEEAELVSPYVPCILLKAIAHTESKGWKHFEADYGNVGTTIISNSCDYGLMQINEIHFTETGIDTNRVITDPIYNIGTATHILIDKWNENITSYIGDNNPLIVEDWYYAVWAYNNGSFFNNPNNPRFDPNRPPFNGTQDPSEYPYQEIVWGYAAHPPSYQGTPLWEATPLTLPPRALITDPPPMHLDTPQPAHQSCRVTYLPTLLKNYPRCTTILQNGGFETGSDFWTLGGKFTLTPKNPIPAIFRPGWAVTMKPTIP